MVYVQLIGILSVDPVSGNYVLGAPQVPRLAIHLLDGKVFHSKSSKLFVNK